MQSRLCWLFFMLILLLISSVDAHEIAIVQGEPDGSIAFMKDMIHETIDLSPGEHDQFSTTEAYSIFHDFDIKDTALIEVLDKFGTSSHDLFFEGLELASSLAPVVYTNIVPINNETCKILAKHLEAAFVVVSGNEGEERIDTESPACFAGNILMIAALDQTRGELQSFSNWGSAVRIAAPCHNIGVIVPGGTYEENTSSTIGSSMVAARLAIFAKQHQSSRGSALINQFLQENAVFLPKLVGKVRNGLALKYKRDYTK